MLARLRQFGYSRTKAKGRFLTSSGSRDLLYSAPNLVRLHEA